MKDHNILFKLLFYLFLCCMLSCSQDENDFYLDSNAFGKIQLYNYNGDEDTTSLTDVLVKFENENYNYTTSPKKNGVFTLNNFQPGIYNVSVSKQDFCTHYKQSIQFPRGKIPTQIKKIALIRKPKHKVFDLVLFNFKYSDIIEFGYEFINASFVKNSCIRLYLGTSPNVSYMNYSLVLFCRDSFGGYYSGRKSIDTLMFPVHSKLYAIAYPAAPSNQGYYDLETGKYIFNAINEQAPSNISELVLSIGNSNN